MRVRGELTLELGAALTTCPPKLSPKIVSSHLTPTAPPGYAYGLGLLAIMTKK